MQVNHTKIYSFGHFNLNVEPKLYPRRENMKKKKTKLRLLRFIGQLVPVCDVIISTIENEN